MSVQAPGKKGAALLSALGEFGAWWPVGGGFGEAVTSAQSQISASLPNEISQFDEQDEKCLLAILSHPFANVYTWFSSRRG